MNESCPEIDLGRGQNAGLLALAHRERHEDQGREDDEVLDSVVVPALRSTRPKSLPKLVFGVDWFQGSQNAQGHDALQDVRNPKQGRHQCQKLLAIRVRSSKPPVQSARCVHAATLGHAVSNFKSYSWCRYARRACGRVRACQTWPRLHSSPAAPGSSESISSSFWSARAGRSPRFTARPRTSST